ncbi:MAG: PqqD family protein [Endomicrobiia bacterium]
MKIFHNEKNIAWRIIDGTACIVTVKDSRLHILNEIGTRIWQVIEKGIEFEDLIEKILQEYEVGPEKLKQDIKEFLDELNSKGLIKIESDK